MTPEQAATIKSAALAWIAAETDAAGYADLLAGAQSVVNAARAATMSAMDIAGVTAVWGSGYLLEKKGTELELTPVPSVD